MLCRDGSLAMHNVITSSFSWNGRELFLVAGIPTWRWVTALIHFHTMVHLVTTWWVAKSYIINCCNQQTVQKVIVLPSHCWQRIIVGTLERTLVMRIEWVQRVVQEWYNLYYKRGTRGTIVAQWVVQKWYNEWYWRHVFQIGILLYIVRKVTGIDFSCSDMHWTPKEWTSWLDINDNSFKLRLEMEIHLN